ncbi:hypothetical protein [Mucilaginibacter pedocola]|uniref:Lipoprotein n=1 Tax=Mucilaginibacter pedocola TaxID=1792845 RepID=A0A1S9PFX8_9SPHI|nr:hypothetical protein [Mucilaginibacter pedocola]OOQ59853.1 hypothetical protein BC343_06830 [Mucilaginibacter pedocola]
MKKVFFSAAMLLALAIVWASCQKNTTNPSAQASDAGKLKTADIGMWHNTALDLLAQQQSTLKVNSTGGSVQPTFNEVREKLIVSLVKENPEIFNEGEIRKSLKALDATKNAATIHAWGKMDGLDKLSSIIETLKDRNDISQQLVNALEDIHKQTKSGVDVETILVSVNKLTTTNFSEKDRKFADAFAVVYNSSYNYWSASAKSANGLKINKVAEPGPSGCNQVIIAADAAGALYGMITGPISSVLEAAAFSFLASINPPCEPAS